MKLDKGQKAALTIIAAGAFFDIATTEVLLAAGSVQIGETVVSFAEANPLFHMLGHSGFLAVYAAVTFAVALAVVYAPKIFQRGSNFYTVALTVLAFYGVVHLVLGWRNFQIISTYLSS